jgi:ISXO2-like transposase domain
MSKMFEGLNILEFTEKFSTDDKCRCYLSDQKWEKGYQCGNCNHGNYHNGKQAGTRVCSKCKYLESATARTLFHRLKFPLRKAFHIIYTMSCNKKGISSYELSRQLSLRQKTCWAFQRKVREAMCSSGKNLLDGTIEVDEFFVGGPEEGKTGRGNEKKKQVVMAIQVDAFGIHRCYAKVIPCASSDELGAFLQEKVAAEATVKTDKWTGYTPCKKDFPNLKQEKSNKGKRHPFMHRQIMMFKAWLRGIHHHCSYLQSYIDEFCYRFNRLKYPDHMFHNLVKTMIATEPIYLQKSWLA